MDKARLFNIAKGSTKTELFSLYCKQLTLVEELQDGINEALEWNWLDEDHPKEAMERLLKLVEATL